jgi:glycosyltransferase involved in cell wall biosynthesis/SAM-dependent methyltransferase
LHQPHEPDPRKAGHHQGRRDNRRRFRAILEDVRRGAPWWLEQREGAKAAVRELTANGRPTHRPAPDRPPARRVRVGVLTIGDPRKGLWRDAQTLVWALRHPPVRPGGPTDAIEVAVFSVANLQRDVERDPRRAVAGSVRDDAAGPATPDETALAAGATAAAAVPAGTAFHRWVADLDVLIGSEVWMPRTFDLARRSKTRVIYVPNLDWAHVDGDTERWVREVRASAVEVWAKTGEAAKVLTSHGVRCAPLRWSVPDPVRRDRPDPEGDAVRLLLLAGMGGWHGRRGVDIALEAFALARAEEPRLELELRSIRPLAEYVGDAPLDTPGLRIVEGLAPRGEVDAAYERARAVLYPTRFDGFGLSLLESLHAGLPVLCTDGDPMRELVEHEHDGLLVPAEHTGAVRLASRWECSTRALAEAMIRLAREPRLLRRLTCPEPGAWVARQRAFVMRVQQIVTGAATPRVVLLHSDATNAGPRLSEHFWADALRAHGYEVDAHPYAADRSVRRAALDRPHDIVLVGKAPVALLRAVRTETAAPLVMWHHDLCDATPGRLRWFREAARLCDLVAVPDDGAGVGGAVVRVLPAAKVHGDRGPGRRPRLRNGDEDEGTVGFLGRATAERAALLRRMGSRFDVRVYGPVAGWHRHRLACDAPVHGVDADDAIRACGLVLSPSARPDLHYTSNRLFHGAAAGGCVLARRFPGLDALYPADAIETYETEADAVTKAAALLADPDRRAAMRRRAEEHSFRHHTWLDRVAQLLDHAASVVGESADAPAAAVEPASAVAPAPTLWEDRARERGELSVGHHRWTRPEFDRETERIWRLVARHLRAARGPADGRLLDFGCGAGRFSVRLSEEGFEVVGADVTAAFVDLARRSAGEAFGLVRVGRQAPLPFTDGAFDVLWTAFTLQHVPDDEFGFLAAELVRVTRPGGLVTLVENTLDHTARTSRSGHMTFRRPDEYRRAFPGVEVIDRIDIEGEEHSLIMGRLRASLDPSDGPRR